MAAKCQKRKFTEIRLNRSFSLKADIRHELSETNFGAFKVKSNLQVNSPQAQSTTICTHRLPRIEIKEFYALEIMYKYPVRQIKVIWLKIGNQPCPME